MGARWEQRDRPDRRATVIDWAAIGGLWLVTFVAVIYLNR